MSATPSKNATWLRIYIIAYVVFLYLPIAIIPIFSFNNSVQAAFPLSGFTFDWLSQPAR